MKCLIKEIVKNQKKNVFFTPLLRVFLLVAGVFFAFPAKAEFSIFLKKYEEEVLANLEENNCTEAYAEAKVWEQIKMNEGRFSDDFLRKNYFNEKERPWCSNYKLSSMNYKKEKLIDEYLDLGEFNSTNYFYNFRKKMDTVDKNVPEKYKKRRRELMLEEIFIIRDLYPYEERDSFCRPRGYPKNLYLIAMLVHDLLFEFKKNGVATEEELAIIEYLNIQDFPLKYGRSQNKDSDPPSFKTILENYEYMHDKIFYDEMNMVNWEQCNIAFNTEHVKETHDFKVKNGEIRKKAKNIYSEKYVDGYLNKYYSFENIRWELTQKLQSQFIDEYLKKNGVLENDSISRNEFYSCLAKKLNVNQINTKRLIIKIFLRDEKTDKYNCFY